MLVALARVLYHQQGQGECPDGVGAEGSGGDLVIAGAGASTAGVHCLERGMAVRKCHVFLPSISNKFV